MALSVSTSGQYIIEFVLPTGYNFSTQDNTSGTEATDSDADATTGYAFVDRSSGDNNIDIDAGMYALQELGNFIWEDLNADGVQRWDEPAIPGVNVQLFYNDGTLAASTTTDANGEYYFSHADSTGQTWEIPNDGVKHNTTYYIVVGNNQFASGVLTVGANTYFPTLDSTDTNLTDSDGEIIATSPMNAFDGFVATQVTTGDASTMDYSIDFGFVSYCPPYAPAIEVTNNYCRPEIIGEFTIDTPCRAGSTIEWSTDNGATWSTTVPIYDNANAMTVIARCVDDIDNTCISPESTPVTSAPTLCCPSPNCFGINIQQN